MHEFLSISYLLSPLQQVDMFLGSVGRFGTVVIVTGSRVSVDRCLFVAHQLLTLVRYVLRMRATAR